MYRSPSKRARREHQDKLEASGSSSQDILEEEDDGEQEPGPSQQIYVGNDSNNEERERIAEQTGRLITALKNNGISSFPVIKITEKTDFWIHFPLEENGATFFHFGQISSTTSIPMITLNEAGFSRFLTDTKKFIAWGKKVDECRQKVKEDKTFEMNRATSKLFEEMCEKPPSPVVLQINRENKFIQMMGFFFQSGTGYAGEKN